MQDWALQKRQSHDIKQNVTAHCVGGSGHPALQFRPLPAFQPQKYTYIRPIKWGAIKTGVTNHNNCVGTEDCKVPPQTNLQNFDCYTVGHFDLFFTLHPACSATTTLLATYLQFQKNKSLLLHLLKCKLFSWQYCCYSSQPHSPRPTNLCLLIQQEYTE